MTVIDITRRLELTDLVRDLRIAARTIRAETMLERRETCVALIGELRERLEPIAELDPQGLEALDVWAESTLAADPNDPDLLQELLYGCDALVRVHLWRETGMPLEPPEVRSKSDI
ncbi:MAG TPA: hypothetical protein VMU72_04465 [Gaiellaceae bacterium]|nr:hypothetical protein [Gaiellaceae bacterium]